MTSSCNSSKSCLNRGWLKGAGEGRCSDIFDLASWIIWGEMPDKLAAPWCPS